MNNFVQTPVEKAIDLYRIPTVSETHEKTITNLIPSGYALVDNVVVDDFRVAINVKSKIYQSVKGIRVGTLLVSAERWKHMQGMRSILYTRIIDEALDVPAVPTPFSFMTKKVVNQFQELAMQRVKWDKFRTRTKR